MQQHLGGRTRDDADSGLGAKFRAGTPDCARGRMEHCRLRGEQNERVECLIVFNSEFVAVSLVRSGRHGRVRMFCSFFFLFFFCFVF